MQEPESGRPPLREPVTPYSSSPSHRTTIEAFVSAVPSPARAAGGGEIFRGPRTRPVVTSSGNVHTSDSWVLRATHAGVEIQNRSTGISWDFNARVVDTEFVSTQVIRLRCERIGAEVFTLRAEGPFFGGGERFESVTLDGHELECDPQDEGEKKVEKRATYAPVSWFFSPIANLGIYVDSAGTCTLDFTEPGIVRVASATSTTTDCYVVIGTSPKSVMTGFTSIVGRTPVPPGWALGVWTNLLRGHDEVLARAQQLREQHVPSSAVWVFDCMEPYSPEHPQVGWSEWTHGVYGSVPAFTAKLRELGFKVLGYVKQWNTRTDFRRSDSLDEWERILTDLLNRDQWDGWMEDFGEAAPTFPMEYHKASHLIASREKPDKVAFCRSGSSGSQSFTQVLWAGDNPAVWNERGAGIAELLPALYSSGFSGFSTWTADIICNTSDRELWKRFLQLGALSAVMRDHLWTHLPENINPFTDDDTLSSYRRYARLHTSFNPYLMAMAAEANRTGVSILRHPLLESPDEPGAIAARYEYFFGDRVFVAPVLQPGETQRTFYLPRGEWINWWSGESVQGGDTVTVPAPIDDIPVLVRAGSVVPLLPDDVETLNDDLASGRWITPGDRLVLRIFASAGDADSRIELADGTVLTARSRADGITVSSTGSLHERQFQIVLPDGRQESLVARDFTRTFPLRLVQ